MAPVGTLRPQQEAELLARHDAAAAPEQVLENEKRLWGQRHHGPAAAQLAALEVELEHGEAQDANVGILGRHGSAEMIAHQHRDRAR